jgi:hypothetical protein
MELNTIEATIVPFSPYNPHTAQWNYTPNSASNRRPKVPFPTSTSMTIQGIIYCIPKGENTEVHNSHVALQCINKWSTGPSTRFTHTVRMISLFVKLSMTKIFHKTCCSNKECNFEMI